MPPKDSDASRATWTNAESSDVSAGPSQNDKGCQLSTALHIHADANAKRTKCKSYRNKKSLSSRFFFGIPAIAPISYRREGFDSFSPPSYSASSASCSLRFRELWARFSCVRALANLSKCRISFSSRQGDFPEKIVAVDKFIHLIDHRCTRVESGHIVLETFFPPSVIRFPLSVHSQSH